MPLEDLDLEFEDEEETRKKKNKEAVEFDVDLEFSAPIAGGPKNRPSGPQPRPEATAVTSRAAAQVTSIAQARGGNTQVGQRPVSQGNAALKSEPTPSSMEVAQLKEELQEARMTAAIADYKVEILSDILSDAKMLDFQIGQILTRLNAKHPESKPELLNIKKLLADFSAKKRK